MARSLHARRLAIAFCAVTVGVAQLGAQQARALPDSLTSAEFWRLFTTMSEEDGSFPSENFVSNEKTYQHVIPTLQRSITRGGVYLGVGPEQNFTYIVNLRPRMAVIFDIRRQNAMLHLMYKALFEMSPTRAEFAARLFSRKLPAAPPTSATPAEILDAVSAAPTSDSLFESNWRAVVERLTIRRAFALTDADLASMRRVFRAFHEAGPGISFAYRLGLPPNPTPWLVTFAELQSLTNADGVNMAFLATEENYRWLRDLESRNLVVPLVGDFAGPKAIRAAGTYLRERGAVVTTFYTSNVEQYLFTGLGADDRFYRNVASLPLDTTSAFIRSLPTPASPLILLNGVATIMLRDSAGRPVTVQLPDRPPAANQSTTGAFISGISSIPLTLAAFARGELRTYTQVTALTKTDGWK